jgi:ComF family protein
MLTAPRQCASRSLIVTKHLRNIGRAALDVLYPPRCVLCERAGPFLCGDCVEGLPRADGARCDACWLPLRHAWYCYACEEHPASLTALRSVFRYEGDIRRLVHAFKFGGQSCLAEALSQQLYEAYEQHELDVDVVMAVPLTGLRRRTRGYNQASLLAQNLARWLALPNVEALSRVGHTTPQAQSPSAEQRRRNVLGAFAVRDAASVAGRRVLLIDDVATTGATLNACAVELLAAGTSEVVGLTLARED